VALCFFALLLPPFDFSVGADRFPFGFPASAEDLLFDDICRDSPLSRCLAADTNNPEKIKMTRIT